MNNFKKDLDTLIKYLSKVGFKKEALRVNAVKIKLAMGAEVLAHITGASGSGKTTLLEEIKKNYPHIVTKDLDEIDDDASAELELSELRKDEWEDSDFNNHQAKRQELLDQFIAQNSASPIILGGYHSEGNGQYPMVVPTQNRFMLDTNAETSAWRAYLRSQKEEPKYRRTKEELPQDIQEAEQDISAFKSMEYESKSYAWILNWVGKQISEK